MVLMDGKMQHSPWDAINLSTRGYKKNMEGLTDHLQDQER